MRGTFSIRCPVPCLTFYRSSLNHSETSIVFVAQENLPRLIALGPKCPFLKVVVSIDDLNEAATRVAQAWCSEYKLSLYTMSQRELFWAQHILTGPPN